MSSHEYDRPTVQLAVTHDLLVGIGPLVIGIGIVVLLIAAVWFGRRRTAREPAPPQRPQARSGSWQTAEEGRRGDAPPDHGPGHQEGAPVGYESRETVPDEVPRDGRRRMPYEIRDAGVRGREPEDPEDGE